LNAIEYIVVSNRPKAVPTVLPVVTASAAPARPLSRYDCEYPTETGPIV
jgi:hypothetical protein